MNISVADNGGNETLISKSKYGLYINNVQSGPSPLTTFEIGPTAGLNVLEGNQASWVITRNGDNNSTQSIRYWTSNGDYSTSSMDAAVIEDFENVDSVITFQPGETTKTVTAEVYKDNKNERTEWFNMNISVADNGGNETLISKSKYGLYINNVQSGPSPLTTFEIGPTAGLNVLEGNQALG